jgi:histidyl-tRNA synthetase
VRLLLGAGPQGRERRFHQRRGTGAPGDARRPWLETSYASDALTFSTWRQSVGASQVGAEGIAELKELARIVRAAGYGPDRIRIDPSVVRGLEYYTGPVFEAELTFEVRDDQGRPVRFGSVGGGGRYDGLVGRFRDGDVPATGFSIGVSRLHAALKAIGSPIVAAARKPGPVVVLAMDRDQVAAYQTLVSHRRRQDLRPHRRARASRWCCCTAFRRPWPAGTASRRRWRAIQGRADRSARLRLVLRAGAAMSATRPIPSAPWPRMSSR